MGAKRTGGSAAWLIAMLAAFLCDRATKLLFSGAPERTLIPGLLRIKSTRNSGVSFGLLAQHPEIMTVLTVLLSLLLVGYVIFTRPKGIFGAGLGLMAGGAAGNALDRILLGAVQDMLDMTLFVCNFADIALCAGTAIVALCLLKGSVQNARA